MKYKFKPLTMLMIETSLVCNSFVATSNNSKSSLSSNYIYLSGDIWNSLLACLAFWLLVFKNQCLSYVNE